MWRGAHTHPPNALGGAGAGLTSLHIMCYTLSLFVSSMVPPPPSDVITPKNSSWPGSVRPGAAVSVTVCHSVKLVDAPRALCLPAATLAGLAFRWG